MKVPSKDMDVLRHRHGAFSILIVIGSMLVGWLWDRPTSFAHTLVSCIAGGAGVWFFLASPLVLRLASHRNVWVRGLVTAIAVTGLVAFMKIVIPHIHRAIEQPSAAAIEGRKGGALATFSGDMFALCSTSTRDLSKRENAIVAAEEFVRANRLDTERACPADQRAKDASGAYEITPICPYYEASSSKAYRADSLDEWGWRVYFLKSSPGAASDVQVFRVVDVYTTSSARASAEVCLRDLEDSA